MAVNRVVSGLTWSSDDETDDDSKARPPQHTFSFEHDMQTSELDPSQVDHPPPPPPPPDSDEEASSWNDRTDDERVPAPPSPQSLSLSIAPPPPPGPGKHNDTSVLVLDEYDSDNQESDATSDELSDFSDLDTAIAAPNSEDADDNVDQDFVADSMDQVTGFGITMPLLVFVETYAPILLPVDRPELTDHPLLTMASTICRTSRVRMHALQNRSAHKVKQRLATGRFKEPTQGKGWRIHNNIIHLARDLHVWMESRRYENLQCETKSVRTIQAVVRGYLVRRKTRPILRSYRHLRVALSHAMHAQFAMEYGDADYADNVAGVDELKSVNSIIKTLQLLAQESKAHSGESDSDCEAISNLWASERITTGALIERENIMSIVQAKHTLQEVTSNKTAEDGHHDDTKAQSSYSTTRGDDSDWQVPDGLHTVAERLELLSYAIQEARRIDSHVLKNVFVTGLYSFDPVKSDNDEPLGLQSTPEFQKAYRAQEHLRSIQDVLAARLSNIAHGERYAEEALQLVDSIDRLKVGRLVETEQMRMLVSRLRAMHRFVQFAVSQIDIPRLQELSDTFISLECKWPIAERARIKLCELELKRDLQHARDSDDISALARAVQEGMDVLVEEGNRRKKLKQQKLRKKWILKKRDRQMSGAEMRETDLFMDDKLMSLDVEHELQAAQDKLEELVHLQKSFGSQDDSTTPCAVDAAAVTLNSSANTAPAAATVVAATVTVAATTGGPTTSHEEDADDDATMATVTEHLSGRVDPEVVSGSALLSDINRKEEAAMKQALTEATRALDNVKDYRERMQQSSTKREDAKVVIASTLSDIKAQMEQYNEDVDLRMRSRDLATNPINNNHLSLCRVSEADMLAIKEKVDTAIRSASAAGMSANVDSWQTKAASDATADSGNGSLQDVDETLATLSTADLKQLTDLRSVQKELDSYISERTEQHSKIEEAIQSVALGARHSKSDRDLMQLANKLKLVLQQARLVCIDESRISLVQQAYDALKKRDVAALAEAIDSAAESIEMEALDPDDSTDSESDSEDADSIYDQSVEDDEHGDEFEPSVVEEVPGTHTAAAEAATKDHGAIQQTTPKSKALLPSDSSRTKASSKSEPTRRKSQLSFAPDVIADSKTDLIDSSSQGKPTGSSSSTRLNLRVALAGNAPLESLNDSLMGLTAKTPRTPGRASRPRSDIVPVTPRRGKRHHDRQVAKHMKKVERAVAIGVRVLSAVNKNLDAVSATTDLVNRPASDSPLMRGRIRDTDLAYVRSKLRKVFDVAKKFDVPHNATLENSDSTASIVERSVDGTDSAFVPSVGSDQLWEYNSDNQAHALHCSSRMADLSSIIAELQVHIDERQAIETKMQKVLKLTRRFPFSTSPDENLMDVVSDSEVHKLHRHVASVLRTARMAGVLDSNILNQLQDTYDDIILFLKGRAEARAEAKRILGMARTLYDAHPKMFEAEALVSTVGSTATSSTGSSDMKMSTHADDQDLVTIEGLVREALSDCELVALASDDVLVTALSSALNSLRCYVMARVQARQQLQAVLVLDEPSRTRRDIKAVLQSCKTAGLYDEATALQQGKRTASGSDEALTQVLQLRALLEEMNTTRNATLRNSLSIRSINGIGMLGPDPSLPGKVSNLVAQETQLQQQVPGVRRRLREAIDTHDQEALQMLVRQAKLLELRLANLRSRREEHEGMLQFQRSYGQTVIDAATHTSSRRSTPIASATSPLDAADIDVSDASAPSVDVSDYDNDSLISDTDTRSRDFTRSPPQASRDRVQRRSSASMSVLQQRRYQHQHSFGRTANTPENRGAPSITSGTASASHHSGRSRTGAGAANTNVRRVRERRTSRIPSMHPANQMMHAPMPGGLHRSQSAVHNMSASVGPTPKSSMLRAANRDRRPSQKGSGQQRRRRPSLSGLMRGKSSASASGSSVPKSGRRRQSAAGRGSANRRRSGVRPGTGPGDRGESGRSSRQRTPTGRVRSSPAGSRRTSSGPGTDDNGDIPGSSSRIPVRRRGSRHLAAGPSVSPSPSPYGSESRAHSQHPRQIEQQPIMLESDDDDTNMGPGEDDVDHHDGNVASLQTSMFSFSDAHIGFNLESHEEPSRRRGRQTNAQSQANTARMRRAKSAHSRKAAGLLRRRRG
jgi:hypothetical protein